MKKVINKPRDLLELNFTIACSADHNYVERSQIGRRSFRHLLRLFRTAAPFGLAKYPALATDARLHASSG